MLKKLLFQNAVFHRGINVTVRNGYKWGAANGELVSVEDVEDNREPEIAHILGVLTVKLNKIPEGILALEHDPKCRTRRGIIAEMKRVYGNDLKEDAPVTVLFFEFEKEEPLIDLALDLDEAVISRLALKAHEKELTLNEYIVDVLTEYTT